MLDSYQRLIRKYRFIFSGALFFSVFIFVTPAAAGTPIAFGQTLSGTIGTFGEIDQYTFDALAGDSLYVLMSTTSGLDPYFRLYAPDGSLIASKPAYSPADAEIDINQIGRAHV